MVFGDQLMIVYSREILSRKPGATFIGEVKCSQTLYNDIRERGGNGIMWKTGHSLIKAKMKEERAELAGEMSGHMFFADRYYGYDDALYAACRLLEIVASSGAPLSALLADALPLSTSVLVVSGRGGFEIIQKALVAGVPIVASVSAPSSLAVQLAREFNLTLIGFLRARSCRSACESNVASGGSPADSDDREFWANCVGTVACFGSPQSCELERNRRDFRDRR